MTLASCSRIVRQNTATGWPKEVARFATDVFLELRGGIFESVYINS